MEEIGGNLGMKLIRTSAIFALLLGTVPLVSGCVSVLPKPGNSPIVVPLRAPNVVARAQTQAPFSISVGLPVMPHALAGVEVTALQDDGSIAYVEGVKFASPAPIGIQSIILGTFDKAVAFRASVRTGSTAKADFELALDVNVFEVTMPQRREAGTAKIEATARLIDIATHRPLATRIFTSTVPAPSGDANQPALALELATQNMAVEIMTWAQSTGRAFSETRLQAQ
ncbi:MAG: hypothetical protein FD163_951 [Hyphomonadaceae bacterium]|nr:MAG: hypothetical protein FD163_951 [Hyphomonadaceae bacterium]